MDFNILHITDFHLSNFEGTDEHFRKRYYREYIDRLTENILEQVEKIDFIILTGDFVDQGKIENYEYIEIIIEYIRKKLDVSAANVGLCIGNHDYAYREDNGINSQEVRAPFYALAKKYANGNPLCSNERACLCKISDSVFFLSIDSTLDASLSVKFAQLIIDIAHDKGKETRNKPGYISDSEVDIIINDFIKNHIPDNSTLLIGCHYPIEKFPNSGIYIEEDDWDSKHTWTKAGHLRNRLSKLNQMRKVWFMGDTHSPDHLQYDKSYFVMTGRIGSTVKKPSQIPRQAKIVNLRGSDSSVFTCNFIMKTHEDSAMDGDWICDSGIFRLQGEKIDSKRSDTNAASSVDYKSQTRIEVEMMSDTVQDEIFERVIKKDLYKFGRFKTSTNHTSLGWVSITPLLNEGKILSSIVMKSVERIEKIIAENSIATIIGLDFWGAIIGSQVSVRTGIVGHCIATRGGGQYHSELELNQNLKSKISDSVTDVFIFIDVISCGETIHKIIESLETIRERTGQSAKMRYHVISVIMGSKKGNDNYFEKVNSLGTFCNKIIIPVVNDEFLPDEQILPYNINFTY